MVPLHERWSPANCCNNLPTHRCPDPIMYIAIESTGGVSCTNISRKVFYREYQWPASVACRRPGVGKETVFLTSESLPKTVSDQNDVCPCFPRLEQHHPYHHARSHRGCWAMRSTPSQPRPLDPTSLYVSLACLLDFRGTASHQRGACHKEHFTVNKCLRGVQVLLATTEQLEYLGTRQEFFRTCLSPAQREHGSSYGRTHAANHGQIGAARRNGVRQVEPCSSLCQGTVFRLSGDSLNCLANLRAMLRRGR